MQGDMDRRQVRAKGFLRAIADFLWPPRSLVSGQRGVGKGPLVPEEFGQIHFLTGPVCDTFGSPLGFDLAPGGHLRALHRPPAALARARAAMVYDAASRRPVLDLKRSGRRDGLETLAGWMLQSGRTLVDEADLIVPVPLHYARLVRRGFNQSAWLAGAISGQSGTPMPVDAITRARRTPSQAGLSARARRRNVAGAFTVSMPAATRISGPRILLVDDVLTTGADTVCLHTCAETGRCSECGCTCVSARCPGNRCYHISDRTHCFKDPASMPKVTIYTRAFCPYCTRALALLKGKKVGLTEIDAGMDAAKKAEMVERSGGGRTFPQIFIGDTHVGGCDEMMALERAGKLDALLAA
jgi:GrxC family glutaredoxin